MGDNIRLCLVIGWINYFVMCVDVFFVYIVVYVVFVYYACLLCVDKFFGLSSILIIADFNIINMFILIVSFYKCCLLMLLKAVAFF